MLRDLSYTPLTPRLRIPVGIPFGKSVLAFFRGDNHSLQPQIFGDRLSSFHVPNMDRDECQLSAQSVSPDKKDRCGLRLQNSLRHELDGRGTVCGQWQLWGLAP